MTKKYLHGIDISSAQAQLNLNKIKCDFVVIKATGGNSYVNPFCNKHYDQAKSSGKLIGLYHFAHEHHKPKPAKVEAKYFIDNISNYVRTGILVLDYEIPLNNVSFNQKDVAWIVEFVKYVKQRTKVIPMLYVSKSLVNSLNLNPVYQQNVGLWYAQYANYQPMGFVDNPWHDGKGTRPWKYPAMFQYTSSGRLKGYNGNLDLDIFYGNSKTWKLYAHQK